MQTKNLVQTSANVIRIINLKKGDIYKRYEDSTYSSGVYYGLVKDIKNNGEQTFIEAIEYKKTYSDISAELKVYSGEKDLAIFPATLDEVKDEFVSVVEKLEEEISTKKKEIANKEKCILDTNKLLSGELSKIVQSAEFKEMTQAEFNQKKLEISNSLEI
jgi:hypothetical protein